MKRQILSLCIPVLLVSIAAPSSAQIPPVRTPSPHGERTVRKTGVYFDRDFTIFIRARSSIRRGSIGGRREPRSILIHSYQGSLSIRAAKGRLLGGQSSLVFNSRIRRFRGKLPDQREFFKMSRPLNLDGVDLCSRGFRSSKFTIRGVVKSASGKTRVFRRTFEIRRSAARRDKLIIREFGAPYFKIDRSKFRKSRDFYALYEHLSNAVAVLEPRVPGNREKKVGWAATHLGNAVALARKNDPALARFLRLQIKKLRKAEAAGDDVALAKIVDEIDYMMGAD